MTLEERAKEAVAELSGVAGYTKILTALRLATDAERITCKEVIEEELGKALAQINFRLASKVEDCDKKSEQVAVIPLVF